MFFFKYFKNPLFKIGWKIKNFTDITEKIILFFEEYNIQGVKAKNFNDFKETSILMKSKLHLTKEKKYSLFN